MKGMQLKGARSSVYIEILCDFSLIILTIELCTSEDQFL